MISVNQVVAPQLSTTVVSILTSVPASTASVIISNVSGATVFIGPGAGGVAPTAANLQAGGFAIPTGAPPVEIHTYPGSTGTLLYVIGATGGTLTGPVSALVATAS